MDDKLLNFLRKREVNEEVIEQLVADKIDLEVISLMTEDQLKKYFPTYGDCLAVMNFSKGNSGSVNKKRNSLIERLKKKLNKQKQSPSKSGSSSDSEEEKHDKKQKRKKTERLVEIGWMCGRKNELAKQVRTKKGGGTRQILVPHGSKKEYILEKAKALFFPDGKSSKGTTEMFDFDLYDFKNNPLSPNITVEELFKITGLTKLRFYLATLEKEVEDKNRNNNENATSTSNPVVIESSEDAESLCEQVPSTSKSFIELETEQIEDSSNLSHFYSNYLVDDASIFELAHFPEESPVGSQDKSESVSLTLHRGHIFNEMLEYFSKNSVNLHSNMEITILENGVPEQAVDLGGVFKDALSEFWSTFYEKCTLGTDFKVPFIRHDFQKIHWQSIAKILYKGYLQCQYFPLKLAPCFMEQCIYGNSHNLRDSLFSFISSRDSKVLKRALENFEDVPGDDLIQILESLESKWIPTAANLETLLTDIAHKEFIQKPSYIVECWHEILNNFIGFEKLQELYKKNIPIPENILPLVKFTEDNNVVGYFKKYIRESSDETLEKLIRFITGANVLTGENISVTFNNLTGLERCPIGRTCTSTIEVSRTYDNYPQFRSEMNSLLSSNIWVMDII